MQINQFDLKLNYENIEKDFYLYRISDFEEITYKNYPKFFNRVKDELDEILSIVYVDYKVYVLTKKKINPNNTELLIQLQNFENLGDKKDFIIFKLLVNGKDTIKNEKVVSDSNGVYYIVKPSKFVYETVLIDIKIDKNSIFFKLSAKNFIDSKKAKYKLDRREKYKNINGSLIRIRRDEKSKSYFVKQMEKDNPKKRSSIDFLKTDYTKKSATKINALIRFFKDIRKNLDSYLTIHLKELFFEDFTLSKTQKKRNKQIEELISEKLSKNKLGVVIEDFVKNNRSQKFIDEIEKILIEKYNTRVVRKSLKKSKSKFNIFITDKNVDNDPYNKIKQLNIPTQNILVENLGNPKIIEVLLKELIIKDDILSNRLTIPYYKSNKKLIFYYFKKELKRKNYKIYRLDLLSNNKIELKEIKYQINLFDENEKNYIEEIINKAKIESLEPELIIMNDKEDINFISKTDFFPIPNIDHIDKEYKELEKPCYKSFNELNSLLIDIPKNLEDVYKQFLETIKNKDKINIKIEVKNRKVKNFLSKRFKLNLKKNLTRSREENTVLDVLTGIKYCKINDKKFYYVVGTKEMPDSFPRTNTIREIEAIKGELFLDDILHMMDEYFVKNRELTVLPYPLKYLREFAKMYKNT